MDLNATPSSERIHIGIFGKRNAGKSSLINAITGQNLAIVSDTKGTTTDPVYKAMEILPLGPVMIIDTPGIDDEGELGTQRVQKAVQVLNKTDIAILVIDSMLGPDKEDTALLARIKEKKLPVIAVFTKAEAAADLTNYEKILGVKCMAVSSVSGKKYAAACRRPGKPRRYRRTGCAGRQRRTKRQAYTAAAAGYTRAFGRRGNGFCNAGQTARELPCRPERKTENYHYRQPGFRLCCQNGAK